MEYITEVRGGWDEWSDEYEVILGVIIDNKEYDRVVKDTFVDENGNQLDVEFPLRKEIGRTISIERYEPEYQLWEVESLSNFEDVFDSLEMTIAVSDL